MKYIHEGRFGPPKCWKTGAVVGTYPRPLLVFSYEPGGLEIVKEPIKFVSLPELRQMVEAKEELPPLTALDLAFRGDFDLESTYVPLKNKGSFDSTVQAINLLRGKNPFPFKTIVVDTVTGLSDAIYQHQAVTNTAALADARKWAGNIGMKVSQVIDYLNSFPCNTVFIFHTEVDKNELTQQIREQPMVYSKLRDFLGAKFSQFFYQHIHMGKPAIRVKPFDVVNGIGSRWPSFAKEVYGPTFTDLYGSEEGVLK